MLRTSVELDSNLRETKSELVFFKLVSNRNSCISHSTITFPSSHIISCLLSKRKMTVSFHLCEERCASPFGVVEHCSLRFSLLFSRTTFTTVAIGMEKRTIMRGRERKNPVRILDGATFGQARNEFLLATADIHPRATWNLDCLLHQQTVLQWTARW